MVECLSSTQKALGKNHCAAEVMLVAPDSNTSLQEVETERSELQGYPQLHNKLEISLDYMTSYLKKVFKHMCFVLS